MNQIKNLIGHREYINRMHEFRKSLMNNGDNYSYKDISYSVNSKQHTYMFLSYYGMGAVCGITAPILQKYLVIENEVAAILAIVMLSAMISMIWSKIFLRLFIKESNKCMIKKDTRNDCADIS